MLHKLKTLLQKAFKQIQSLAANRTDLKTIIDPIKNNIKYFTGGYERERDETHKKETKEESRVTEYPEKMFNKNRIVTRGKKLKFH